MIVLREGASGLRFGSGPAVNANTVPPEGTEASSPHARTTDPVTSHEAAAAVKPGSGDMQKAIRAALAWQSPQTAEQIAQWVVTISPARHRWLASTIVTACNPKRSGLKVVGHTTNRRGRRVQLLSLP